MHIKSADMAMLGEKIAINPPKKNANTMEIRENHVGEGENTQQSGLATSLIPLRSVQRAMQRALQLSPTQRARPS